MPVPPLAVVIPSHGRPVLLRETLDSVAACERPDGYAGCVVVENGPRAGAEDIVCSVAAAHPDGAFRYLHHDRANKSTALNAALSGISSDTLCVFFDDDIRVSPQTLEAYSKAADREGDAEAYFGGPMNVHYEAEPPEWVRHILPLSAQGTGYEACLTSSTFMGCNWAAYAGSVRDVGDFDPDFGPGSPSGATGQETNMQHRLSEAGLRPVGVPAATVSHFVPSSRVGFRWALRRWYRSGVGHGIELRSKREPVSPYARPIVGALARMAWGGVRLDRGDLSLHLARTLRYAGILSGYLRTSREPSV